MEFETLTLANDFDRVAALYAAAADYVILESGSAPSDATVHAFFKDKPHGTSDHDLSHIGVVEGGKLVGIVGLCFGYPSPYDCYIGMMLFTPAARGHGRGARALAHVTDVARARGATRALVAVLDANTKGRAFWERQGFTFEKTFPPSGDAHTRHRMVLDIQGVSGVRPSSSNVYQFPSS